MRQKNPLISLLFMPLFFLGGIFCACPHEIFAQDAWPPQLIKSEDFNGRLADWYTHGTRDVWQSRNPNNQIDSFTVLHPVDDAQAQNRPMYVVLHSAGHDLVSCLECTRIEGDHDIYHTPQDFYGLYVDCRANIDYDWWWGGIRADEAVDDTNRFKAGGESTAVEKRVIDTVLWAIQTYNIDPNRVYLGGNSMGGSGTLGLGMPHGEIFAAIKANVPAGVCHAAHRMYFPPTEIPAGVQLTDPPVCIDYSGTNDAWSQGHEIFFRGMKERKYPLLAYWGNFGHDNNHGRISKVNDLIDTFEWMNVRKDLAYPVFTNASTDTAIPWPHQADATEPGQVNAFFRWENLSDSPEKLEMTLYLISPEDLGSKIFTAPASSVADVSFRRLQQFHVQPGQRVDYTFGADQGTVQADSSGLVTLPQLTMTLEPKTVTLTLNNAESR